MHPQCSQMTASKEEAVKQKIDLLIEKALSLLVWQNRTSTGATNALVQAASMVSWLWKVIGGAFGT